MSNIVSLRDLSHPGVAPYTSLTEAQLRNRLHPEHGMFIAESPKVIRLALNAGFIPESMLCESRHIEGDAADIIARCPGMTVYTGSRELLAELTGYTLTRGVLCAMRRREQPSLHSICAGARRLAVIDSVTDTTNIGAIFRSAAALGIDGVVLTQTTCDPLNRRAVRVSMGTVFQIPWCMLGDNPYAELRREGFKIAAMALTDKSVPIDDATVAGEPRLAIVLGTEGDGLSTQAICDADYTLRIPMSHDVDSLNVAAASAVAFWQLRAEIKSGN